MTFTIGDKVLVAFLASLAKVKSFDDTSKVYVPCTVLAVGGTMEPRYQVTPINGEGKAWVRAARVKRYK